MRLEFSATPLAGLTVVKRWKVSDQRGYLTRLFSAAELAEVGFRHPVAQVNHTLTVLRGTVRGMHFQKPPYSEDKLVTCIRGELIDVAVDLRAGSPTLLQWHAEILSADEPTSLLIPAGFAHGFQSLVDDCELLYVHSKAYAPGAEGAVNALDPTLAIRWPLDVTCMSERDRNHELLPPGYSGIKP